ncbi:DUF4366 domain-containing protein [uncultured Dysosmobacter sp.]|uniref:DUF4366 domain-containing protein n=1 Tax=uncultured Dysosmobacter sp. TaxID=2591384 RepID=UPI002607AC7F|nr:DUF4366 domain-containing protein [uncultured Dysosmobacter sp.]
MRKLRYLTAALCAVVLLCGFTFPAYASGGEAWEDVETVTKEPVQTTEPTPAPTVEPTREGLTPVNPLTPDGQGTLLDNATGEEGKEFFTITTADESVFYLVIDRQKSGENVYFLNTVTVDDLMALAEPGKEEAPAPAVTPEPEPAPTPDVEPEPEPEKSNGGMGTLLLALAVVVIGGGAGWYFKIYRPKQQRAADLEEDDYPDGPEPSFEDGYDDTPPWDEGDGE